MRFILALALTLTIASPALAIDFTASGTILTVTYKEPVANVDNSPLNDLDHTSVYFQVGTGTETKSAAIPATALTGGGSISTQITVPIAQNQSATVTVRATATDKSGNESAKSSPVTKTVDRLPPLPPS